MLVYVLISLGLEGAVPYVKCILCLNAFAASGERHDCACYLEPLAKVRLELETNVGFGVVALSIP
jgi:hypothetical protein